MIPKLPNMKPISAERVKDIGRVKKLLPTESDVASTFGAHRIERKHRADGSYSWRLKLKTNEHGKPTMDQKRLLGLMSPAWKADVERASKVQGGPGSYGVKSKSIFPTTARTKQEQLRYGCSILGHEGEPCRWCGHG